jgi:hypothetical protein
MKVHVVSFAALLAATISFAGGRADAQTTGGTTTPANAGKTTTTTSPTTTGEWKSGRTYLVTDPEKTIRFGGKDVVLPQGAEFTFQDGFFVVVLSKSSQKDSAVVRVGASYVVITKREQLVIDPNGVARNPKYAFRLPPRRTPYRPAINDLPNASPFEP